MKFDGNSLHLDGLSHIILILIHQCRKDLWTQRKLLTYRSDLAAAKDSYVWSWSY